MKLHPLFLFSLLGVSAYGAPIPLPTSTTYTQDFNTLFMRTTTGTGATTSSWTDDSTIPGWWIARAGNPAAAPPTLPALAGTLIYHASDGSAAPTVGNIFSAGVANSPDRFLAVPPTTNNGTSPVFGGESSAFVIFQNTHATKAMDLSNVKYHARALRANGTVNNIESIFCSYKTGATQADITNTLTAATATTAIFPAAVSSGPVSGYLTGWTTLDECRYTMGTYTAGQVIALDDTVNVVPASRVRVAPGQFLAFRWANINDNGTDAVLGIDGVELTFVEAVGVSVFPTVSNVVRNNNGTPENPDDDKINFDLTVSGSGPLAAGWTITSPATPSVLNGITGTYGTVKSITDVPIADFAGAGHAISLVVEDDGVGVDNGSTTVTAPWTTINAAVSAITRDPGVDPANPADDTWGFTLTVTGAFTGTGWTSTNANIPAGTYTTSSTITGLALNLSPLTSTIADNVNTTITSAVTATVPPFVQKVTATNSPMITFNAPAVGAGTFVAPDVIGAELGWAGGTTGAITLSNVQTQPAPSTETLKYFHLTTNGTSLVTNGVDVNALKGFSLLGSLKLSFYSTSSTGLDDGDSLNFRIEVAQDGNFANTAGGNILTTYIGNYPATPDNTAARIFSTTISASSPYINLGSAGPPAIPYPSTDFTFHPFSAIAPIPASATNPLARIVVQSVTGISNTEHILVDDILFTGSFVADYDGDGMTDAYESANGLNPASGADKLTDLDGDGQTNCAEFIAGTAANNAASTLRILEIVATGTPGVYDVSVATVIGKKYQLQESSDLGAGDAWADLGPPYTATAATTVVSVNVSGLGARHFVQAKVVP